MRYWRKWYRNGWVYRATSGRWEQRVVESLGYLEVTR